MSKSESPPQLVFVSHKSDDARLARSIVELLKSEMDNVSFFLSEDIEKGDVWREEIVKTLKEANCLLLIYTGLVL